MSQYLIKRIIFAFITLFVVSIILFGISKLAHSDPIARMLNTEEDAEQLYEKYYLSSYKSIAQQFDLDKPVFYFSFMPTAFPDSLHRILPLKKRQNCTQLIAQSGNWPSVDGFVKKREQFFQQLKNHPNKYYDPLIAVKRLSRQLNTQDKYAEISKKMSLITQRVEADSLLRADISGSLSELKAAFAEMSSRTAFYKLYWPAFRWYGLDNQYHRWLTSMISGEMGISYSERRPVSQRLGEAIGITLQLNGLAILLAFVLAIPIGVYSAIYPGQWFDRITGTASFIFYSLPSFWLAVLALVFLTNPEYGMDWFPAMGLGSSGTSSGWLSSFLDRLHHLVLPVFCLGIGAVAFIARQQKAAMQKTMGQDFIRTARAKGLSESQVIWRHGFRNSLFPIITILANILPALIAGSVVIEQIFAIPGMGFLTLNAIVEKDWPVVYAVGMLGAFFTVVGILMADLLYALLDPRVKMDK